MTPETDTDGPRIGEEQFPIEEIWTAINALLEEQPNITTQDVATEVGCTRETARVKLHELQEDGQLASRKVGAAARIWYPPSYDPVSIGTISDPSVSEQTPEDSSSATEQIEGVESSAPEQAASVAGQTDERILFFPSRREVVVDNPGEETRSILSQTAHLIDSTGDGYLYKIDEADVWTAPYDEFEDLKADLLSIIGEDDWSPGFEDRIRDDYERAHTFRLHTHEDGYTVLEASDPETHEDVAKRKLAHNDHYTQFVGDRGMRLKGGAEAEVKEILYEEGYPAIDERRLDEGDSLNIRLTDEIELRDYQRRWVEHFKRRRSGTFVGPSGSGKTIAAIGAMEAIAGETLIVVPNREMANQWEDELLDKTNLGRYKIGQYHGGEKNIRPVTIATYDTAAMSRHRKIFNERAWGLVIADECHHAVADTWKRFREIQSVARLGLSATPVRESGDAKEIFTLIGPPVGSDWGRLFSEGYVERPDVELIMVPWASTQARERYRDAEGNAKSIEAAKNPTKIDAIEALLERHEGQKTLIFVDWIKPGQELADALGIPFIFGETSHADRESAYTAMREGDLQALIVSRIGDEGIDLPDAEIAILASTMGSSRSQTGQRTGRTMRPEGESQVYILLTKGSGEEDWGRNSTQYLAEKGIDVTKTDFGEVVGR